MRDFDESFNAQTQNETKTAAPDMCNPEFNNNFLKMQNQDLQANKGAEPKFLVMAEIGKDAASHEAAVRRTGDRALGRELLSHLKDQDWLIEHQKEVRHALEKAWFDLGLSKFKEYVNDLEKRSGGNLYLREGNGIGALNPLNPPGNQVARAYLKRGLLVPDTLIFDSRNQTSWGP